MAWIQLWSHAFVFSFRSSPLLLQEPEHEQVHYQQISTRPPEAQTYEKTPAA